MGNNLNKKNIKIPNGLNIEELTFLVFDKKGNNVGKGYNGKELKTLINNITEAIKPYKSYTALLTQLNTDAPTAIVLENTLKVDVSFSYDSVGVYKVIFSDAVLTTNKTTISLGNLIRTFSVDVAFITSSVLTETEFVISTSDFENNPTNGILENTLLEIRVYE